MARLRMFNVHYAPTVDLEAAAAAIAADMAGNRDKASYSAEEIRALAGINPREWEPGVHLPALARRIGTRLEGDPE